MARVARHVERLSAGDEGNAVVDAVDAVNLMTVHAAKGLEFPVVFAVNLGRGTGGARDAVVMTHDETGRPLVSVAGLLSEAAGLAAADDREETKRLLYVAVTRARDRLYLGALIDDKGQPRIGRGSLAEVMPASVRDLLGQAASAANGAVVEWHGSTGVRHRFRVCAARATEEGAGDDSASAPPAAACRGRAHDGG